MFFAAIIEVVLAEYWQKSSISQVVYILSTQIVYA